MTFEKLQERIGRVLNPDEWHQHANGGGWVENTATVGERATVGDRATVDSTPFHIFGSRHGGCVLPDGIVQIGCQIKHIDVWLRDYKEIGKENNYLQEEIEEYRCLLVAAKAWVDSKRRD